MSSETFTYEVNEKEKRKRAGLRKCTNQPAPPISPLSGLANKIVPFELPSAREWQREPAMARPAYLPTRPSIQVLMLEFNRFDLPNEGTFVLFERFHDSHRFV